jgi:hypothetical protein
MRGLAEQLQHDLELEISTSRVDIIPCLIWYVVSLPASYIWHTSCTLADRRPITCWTEIVVVVCLFVCCSHADVFQTWLTCPCIISFCIAACLEKAVCKGFVLEGTVCTSSGTSRLHAACLSFWQGGRALGAEMHVVSCG